MGAHNEIVVIGHVVIKEIYDESRSSRESSRALQRTSRIAGRKRRDHIVRQRQRVTGWRQVVQVKSLELFAIPPPLPIVAIERQKQVVVRNGQVVHVEPAYRESRVCAGPDANGGAVRHLACS